MRNRYAWGLLLLWGWVSFAQAEPDKSFSMLLGVADSSSQDRGHLKDPFTIQWDYLDQWFPVFSLGATGGFFMSQKYEGKNQEGPIDPNSHVEAKGSGYLFFVGPEVQVGYAWELSRHVKIHPYGVLGSAFYSAYFSGSPPPETQEPAIHVWEQYGGMNYGGGLTFIFNETFGLGADFRQHQLFRPNEPNTIYNIPSIQLITRF